MNTVNNKTITSLKTSLLLKDIINKCLAENGYSALTSKLITKKLIVSFCEHENIKLSYEIFETNTHKVISEEILIRVLQSNGYTNLEIEEIILSIKKYYD